jgi:hypothetical protein
VVISLHSWITALDQAFWPAMTRPEVCWRWDKGAAQGQCQEGTLTWAEQDSGIRRSVICRLAGLRPEAYGKQLRVWGRSRTREVAAVEQGPSSGSGLEVGLGR